MIQSSQALSGHFRGWAEQEDWSLKMSIASDRRPNGLEEMNSTKPPSASCLGVFFSQLASDSCLGYYHILGASSNLRILDPVDVRLCA